MTSKCFFPTRKLSSVKGAVATGFSDSLLTNRIKYHAFVILELIDRLIGQRAVLESRQPIIMLKFGLGCLERDAGLI